MKIINILFRKYVWKCLKNIFEFSKILKKLYSNFESFINILLNCLKKIKTPLNFFKKNLNITLTLVYGQNY